MADHTSAGIFGEVFKLLAKNPDERNKELAKEIWGQTWSYDFMHYDMDCDNALGMLGLAKFREKSSDEYIDYAEQDGKFKDDVSHMTKEQAIKAMQEGHKVTHRYFSDHEWIIMQDGMVVGEDGVKWTPEDFWGPLRDGLAWNDDWLIWKEKE